jgi:hypothetical protein
MQHPILALHGSSLLGSWKLRIGKDILAQCPPVMLQTAQECQEEPPLLCQLLSEDSNCITTSQVRQNDLAQEVVLWSMTCMQTAAVGCMQSTVHAVLQKQVTQLSTAGGTSL